MFSDELVPGSDKITRASEEWVVTLSNLVYDVYGAAHTRAAAVAALGLKSVAFEDPRNCTLNGGHATFDVLRVKNQFPKEPTDAVPLGFAQSALFASGVLPFTAPGDLLVYKHPFGPYVVPVGTAGQVFSSKLEWIDAPIVSSNVLPPNVIGAPLSVAIGSTAHPQTHDLYFPTLTAFNAWAVDKIVLSRLTLLPDSFGPTATGTLVLPPTSDFGSIVIGQPTVFTANASGAPVSELKLIARGSTLVSTVLSLFSEYEVDSCRLEIDELYVPVSSSGLVQTLFRNCRGRIDNLVFENDVDVPNFVWELRSCELDIGTLGFGVAATSVTKLVLRAINSDLHITEIQSNFLDSALVNKAMLEAHNSNIYVSRSWDISTLALAVASINSNLHFAGGVSGVPAKPNTVALVRGAASSLVLPYVALTGADDEPQLLTVASGSKVKLGSRGILNSSATPERNMYGVSEDQDDAAHSPIGIGLGAMTVISARPLVNNLTLTDNNTVTSSVVSAGIDSPAI